MKRLLVRSLLVTTLLLLALVVTVLLRADPPLPPPDPATVIHLADGSSKPLAEVLELARESRLPEAPAPSAPPATGKREPDEDRTLPSPLSPAEATLLARRQAATALRVEAEIAAMKGTVYELARQALDAGRLDEASALYLSVPEDDPWYADARRDLAWNVLADGQGQPRRAVPYVHEALVADPLNGNSWQDAARVYAATLGVDVD